MNGSQMFTTALSLHKHHLLMIFGLLIYTTSSLSVANESIKLPPQNFLVGLNTTQDDALGINDDDIGLKRGEFIKPFNISTHDGHPVQSSELLKKAPLLIIFYRGGWCPYCNQQIHQLVEAYPEFEKRGVTPILISVDETDGAALAQRTYEIPFPVLSDPDLLAHSVFKVTMQVDAKTVEQYKGFGIDLEEWSQRKHHTIAVSSAFLVDSKGQVQWAHASRDYKTRPSPAQLLNMIDHIEGK